MFSQLSASHKLSLLFCGISDFAPVLSSASSTYQPVSSSFMKCPLPSLSATSSLVTGSSSSSQSSPLSLSASLPLSPSLSLSSSITPSPSLLPPPSPSISPPLTPPSSSPVHLLSSTSSALSPSPSLVVSSNTGSTPALPQMTSSFLPSTQSQTARLPAFTTGQILSTSRAERHSVLPFNSDDNSNEKASTVNPHLTTSAGMHSIKLLKVGMCIASSSALLSRHGC